MPPPRPRLLRRRDFHTFIIVSVIALCNVFTTVCFFTLVTPRVNRAYAVSLQCRDISSNCYVHASTSISNCIEYLSYLDLTSSSARETDLPLPSPDDVVGVYGYGQTHSSTSTWLYRDDRLRDGRSRRVYLRRIPRQ